MFTMSYKDQQARILASLDQMPSLVDKNDLEQIKYIVFTAEKFRNNWCENEYIIEALKKAALTGRSDIVNFFIQHGVSPNVRYEVNGDMKWLLLDAVDLDDIDVVNALIDKIAGNKNQILSDILDKALSHAVYRGNLELVKVLLVAGANPNTPAMHEHFPYFGNQTSVLLLAAAIGDIRVAEILFQHGASVENAIMYAQTHYQGVISDLERIPSDKIQHKDKIRLANINKVYHRVIAILLDLAVGLDLNGSHKNAHADLSFIARMNVAEMNFVGISVDGVPIKPSTLEKFSVSGIDQAYFKESDLEILNEPYSITPSFPRYHVLKNRLVNIKKLRGELLVDGYLNVVSLEVAVEKGDLTAVQSRLMAGVDPNYTSSHLPPIVEASIKGHLNIVAALLACKNPSVSGSSIVWALACAKQVEIKNILRSHVSISQCDDEGNMQLHYAARNGDIDEVGRLLQLGANVAAENKFSLTALHLAVRNGHYGIIKLLVSKDLLQKIANVSVYFPDYNQKITLLGACICYSNNTAARNMIYLLDKCAEWDIAVDIQELVVGCVEKRVSEVLAVLLPRLEKIENWDAGLMHKVVLSDSSMQIIKLLKSHGADINVIHPEEGSLVNKAVRQVTFRPDRAELDPIFSSRLRLLINEGACFANEQEKKAAYKECEIRLKNCGKEIKQVYLDLIKSINVQNIQPAISFKFK